MCNICGKSFALQCNLKAHVKLHMQCRRSGDVAKTRESILQRQKAVFPNPFSLEHHQQGAYYNHVFNFGFGRMFPFNQKFLLRLDAEKS